MDFFAARVDSCKVRDMEFTINLVTPDKGEKFAVELARLRQVEGKGEAGLKLLAPIYNWFTEGFRHRGPKGR